MIDGTWWIWDFDNGEYKNSSKTGSFEDSAALNQIIENIQIRLQALENTDTTKAALVEFLTQDEYDFLLFEGKVIPEKIYFIFSDQKHSPESLTHVYVGSTVFATRLASGKIAPVSFPEGIEFGDYQSGRSGGIIDRQGHAELQSLKINRSLLTNEVIFNRISAQDGDAFFSENGVIENIELIEDGTYTLHLQKKHDNDIMTFAEGDILYGQINDISSTGELFVSWMRVLTANHTDNSVNVVLYQNSEVPGGSNHNPIELMRVTRRGNAINADRQSYWYLSATTEKCFIWLEGVDKPILEEHNYYIMIGRPARLSIFNNLPINYQHSYVYARGGIFQDLLRVDFSGDPVQELLDRGYWSLATAHSDNPYIFSASRADTVWHYGCRWKCLSSGTTQEPKYSSSDWAMLEGNPEFSIEIESTKGWVFTIDKFSTTLFITGQIYNQDVTNDILDSDVTWTRDTGNEKEDAAWAALRAEAGKELKLTVDDLGPEYSTMTSCTFRCVVLLRDGQTAENYVTF